MVKSPGVFFRFFFRFLFFGPQGVGGRGQVKGQKMAKDEKKNLSVAVDISGTIYRMIVIFGALK